MEPKTIAEMFYLDEAGILRWRKSSSASASRQAGDIAGYLRKDGYVYVSLKSKKLLAHRIVWALHYGVWPNGVIDHINGDKSDNSISNLRCCTNRQNLQNMHFHRNGHVAGTTKVGSKWQAQIRVGGKRIYLGVFDTQEKASSAYRHALSTKGAAQ